MFQSSRKKTSLKERYEQLRTRYAMFCVNPLRTRVQVEAEFDQLLHTPHLTTIDFYSDHVMMLGTDEVTIRHPDQNTHHRIGEFIIFVIRERVGRGWEVDFRFRNVTRTLSPTEDLPDGQYMHPHILCVGDQKIGTSNGRLCIANGGYQIHQHIRRGEIHLAAPLLVDVLHTYDDDFPYYDLLNWPLLLGDKT